VGSREDFVEQGRRRAVERGGAGEMLGKGATNEGRRKRKRPRRMDDSKKADEKKADDKSRDVAPARHRAATGVDILKGIRIFAFGVRGGGVSIG